MKYYYYFFVTNGEIVEQEDPIIEIESIVETEPVKEQEKVYGGGGIAEKIDICPEIDKKIADLIREAFDNETPLDEDKLSALYEERNVM